LWGLSRSTRPRRETPWTTPLDEDTEHATYDLAYVVDYAYPSPEAFADGTLSPDSARWDETLGEYILDWDDVRAAPDPHDAALAFAHSAVAHACRVCDWDTTLTASVEGNPPPIN
jgi:hypothetical protein